MALLNRRVLVQYDVGGPVLWHERLPLEHLGVDDYVVVTPDRDIYVEELSVVNSDLRGIRVPARAGAVPAWIAAHEIYGLPNWTAAEMSAIRDEARRIGADERARRAGAPEAGQNPGGGGAPAGGPGLANPAPAVVEPYPEGQLKWLAADKHAGYVYGQEVFGVTAQEQRDAKFVYVTRDNQSLFVQCVDGRDLAAFLSRNTRGDIRVLDYVLNALHQPERTLKEVATLCRESDVKWKLPGPRTTLWCINYLSIEGLWFEGHHERLRQVCKVDTAAWGIQEHFQVSMALRQALLVDQLDGSNLLSVEVQFRRLQTIEFSYAEKAREADSKGVGGRLSLEEQVSFGGVTRQFATLMICPSLVDHVKAETEREAVLAKSLRKAGEEREAARKAAGPAKKKGQQQEADP